MTGFLYRTFHLREGEAGLVFSLGFLLIANSIAMQISGIVGIAGLLDDTGPNGYLLALGVDYVIVLIIAAVQSLIVDRFNRIKLMGWVTFGFALVFVFIRAMFLFPTLGGFPYTLMYIVSEQQWVVFPLVFWILANDVLSPSQARRLFPVIASLGIIGKLMGIGVTLALPNVIEQFDMRKEEVVIFNILIYLLAYVLIQWRFSNVEIRKVTRRSETLKETLSEAWGFITEVPAFRYLMLSILSLTVCDTIMEFYYYSVTHAQWPGDAYLQFLSIYRLVTTLLALATQGFLTARVINAIGLKNTFWFLPIVTVLGTIWMLATPFNLAGVISAIGAMAGLKLIRDNTDDSARKSFQAIVPEERRGRVSTFMDSYLPGIGTVLGCAIAGVIIWLGGLLGLLYPVYAYLGVTLVLGVFAIWAVYMVTRVYDASMLNWRLKRRQRGAGVLDALLGGASGSQSEES